MSREEFWKLFENFQGISAMLKEYDQDEIKSQAADIFSISVETLDHLPMGGYSKGKTSGAYHFVLQDLQKNIAHYDWFYERLADDSSRFVFTKLLQFRILPDMKLIKQACDEKHSQYFDKTLVSCDEGEIFADCGGYIGDTAEEFIKQYKKYKRIYTYEPSDANLVACRKNLKNYKNIVIKKCGVGEKNCLMPMSGAGSSGSFMGAVQDETTEYIEMISLDEDIQEDVTFIKMDIEGFEIPAIIGAKNHIRKNSPKLAVCLYHIVSDIWEIPRLIDNINPNYNFHIRHYRPDQNWETVLYAIPKKKKHHDINLKKQKRVVAMAPYERGWSNVELIKDCGLIPYLLYKNHNCMVRMVGANGDNYTNLEQYVKGIQMEFLQTGSIEEKCNYIKSNAVQIDCLVLRGCYPTNFDIAILYKQLNPEGKIYVGLDANSHWMDRIDWSESEFTAFMSACDVIATSCRAMQKHLNEKWPWKIEFIPNGYYSFNSDMPCLRFEEKENVILTVGRLGTPQKATHILLNAFAAIADTIPGWKLRLVGSIEESFKPYIEKYFDCYPLLKERVIFVGSINSRELLMEEYRKAKIFALTSILEGGSPNVISEALNAGCAMAVTKYDAYEDTIDSGNCGMAVRINDTRGFADILVTLCKSRNLAQMSQNAYHHGLSTFNMEKVVARLNYMLFEGGR